LLRIGVAGSDYSVVADVIIVVLKLGKPLESIAGPVNRMQEEKIVKIWRLFLPDFVLLVNYHLFFLVKLYVQA
jgi:hypothetical protein